MKALGLGELLKFAEASPVRHYINRICVLDGYDGPVAYYNNGLVISKALWERVKEAAVTVPDDHDPFSGRFSGLPVEFLDPGVGDHQRFTLAARAGLFAKVTNDGKVLG